MRIRRLYFVRKHLLIKDQTAPFLQSDLDPHCPHKLFESRLTIYGLISCQSPWSDSTLSVTRLDNWELLVRSHTRSIPVC